MNIKIQLSIFSDCAVIDWLVAVRNSVGTSFSSLFLFGLASLLLLDTKNWMDMEVPSHSRTKCSSLSLCSLPACHSCQEFLV